MIVRDRMLKLTDYKGRRTEADDRLCPCRACYNPHDCGYYSTKRVTILEWVVMMECATRWNRGCPEPLPEPQHVYSGARGRTCKRCGARR